MSKIISCLCGCHRNYTSTESYLAHVERVIEQAKNAHPANGWAQLRLFP